MKVGHIGRMQMGPPDIGEAKRQQKAKDRKENEELSDENKRIGAANPAEDPSIDSLDNP